MSSRLFTEVREKRGLAYAIKSGIDRYIDTGYFAVYAGTDPKNATEAIKVILNQLYGLSGVVLHLE
jgi:predicted Zn-dependent peptidase